MNDDPTLADLASRSTTRFGSNNRPKNRSTPLARVLQGGFVLSIAALLGCNYVPIDSLERTFSYTVETKTGSEQKIKIDFLWVVDNSTSMCQEQLALAESFQEFTNKIQTVFDIDARIAVTSTDMQCDIDPSRGANASMGTFNQVPAQNFDSCPGFSETQNCKNDADCPSSFSCAGPNVTLESCATGINGSPLNECQLRCSTDQDCAEVIGDSTYQCRLNKCVKPPATSACDPAECDLLDTAQRAECYKRHFPPFVSTEADDIDRFPCVATLGVYTATCFGYEQGLKAALTAVDSTSGAPQQAQAANFLRDDAYLVIVIVSDEDDCSTIDGQEFKENSQYSCAFQPTTDDGGILIPVRHYVNRFKGLKADPSQVIVAAITGDAMPATSASFVPPTCEALTDEVTTNPSPESLQDYLQCARQAYRESKTSPRTCNLASTVCSGPGGKADWGSRYQELTTGFGANGLFLNICEASGIGGALDAIADLVIEVVNQVCLPRPILDGSEIMVVKTLTDGSEVILVEGSEGPDGYTLQVRSDKCSTDGTPRPLLRLQEPPGPGETVRVSYRGCVDGISGESSCDETF